MLKVFDVAKLISEKNIVAIYQGRAEIGPRALGNRSIIYDPRDQNGRDIINDVKGREKFRPFAGTVLEEYAHEWFDMGKLERSPFMMYAVKCKDEYRDIVPALQHNDGTCRVQTVSYLQNPHYYNLIKCFYDITGIPMVLNTSFNLSGEALVDTMDDALWTCRNGKIPYLYCPEKGMMIKFS